MKNYIELKNLEVYRLSRMLSRDSWLIYKRLDWSEKKIMGDQFIRSIDSVGANIAEGYKRYHYLDKIRFYYNARASLSEAVNHWAELLQERELLTTSDLKCLQQISQKLEIKLANFIKKTN